MNNIENLVIDNYPQIKKNKIITEYPINSNEEISISINNSIIFSKENIKSINENIIEFSTEYEINIDDIIVVIYNKI